MDCPRQPVPIYNVIHPSRKIPPTPIGKVSLRALYEGWSRTGTLLAHNLANFFNFFVWKIIFCTCQMIPHFQISPMFLINAVMPGLSGKFLGSAINFPSMEVHLKKGPKRAFLCAERSLLRAQLSVILIFPSWGMIFSFLGMCWLRDGDDGALEEEERKVIYLLGQVS